MHEIETQAAKAAEQLVECLSKKSCTLALAESCTAGLVSDLIARISGASAVLWGSFVCYSASAKGRMLGIDGDFLKRHGMVSKETAQKMASAALDLSQADIAAAVTGIAGPLGDGSDTPVGTVWVAVAKRKKNNDDVAPECWHEEKEWHFQGNRADVRMQAAEAVIKALLEELA
jgi:PncC family amidohydrolase